MALGWGLDIHAWPPVVVRSTEIGDMWKPMALAVMYGLLLATMLTLVQVPVMYSLTATIVEGLKRRFGRRLSE
jgi:Cu/Ag efflux pump CusA